MQLGHLIMRRTTILALATFALSLDAGEAAFSADLTPAPPRPARAPVSYAPPPVHNWGGFYVGGFAGGAFGAQDVQAIELGNQGSPLLAYNGIGNTWSYGLGASFIGGGTVGWNWQVSAFVVGIEGEVGYLHLTGSAFDPHSPAGANIGTTPDTQSSARIGDWYAVAAGRLGWAVTPDWLLYAKGGAVWTKLNANVVDSCNTGTCGVDLVNASGSKTTTGWTLGAGVEWMFAPQWSVKAEYLFLGIEDHVHACGTDAIAQANFCWTHNFGGVHTVKAGLNFHF